jgi:hypothetical protein
MQNSETEIVLLKDSEWSKIDGQPCKVLHFTPFATIDNGKIKDTGFNMPYCALTIECRQLPNKATGYITHKIDFVNLWKVFKERGVHEQEEVIIFWTKENYKHRL